MYKVAKIKININNKLINLDINYQSIIIIKINCQLINKKTNYL